VHGLPAVLHLPGLRSALGDRIDHGRYIEVRAFGEVDRLRQSLDEAGDRNLIDHFGELAGTGRPDALDHACEARDHRLCAREGLRIAPRHDGENAILRTRLTA